MSHQTITTNKVAQLGPDAEITLDGSEILAAIIAALDDAAQLGGHAQSIERISVSVGDEEISFYGERAKLARTASITVETRLT